MGRLYRRPCIRTKRGGMNMTEKEYEIEITQIYLVQGKDKWDAVCKAQDTDIVDLVDYKVLNEYELEE